MKFSIFHNKQTLDHIIHHAGIDKTYKDKKGNSLLQLALIHQRPDVYELDIWKASDQEEENIDGISAALMKQYLTYRLLDKFPSICFECKGVSTWLNKKDFEEKFKIKYLNHLLFQNYAIFSSCFLRTKKKIEDKKNRQMNRWAKAMFEREFEQGFVPKLMIKYINSLIGHGIYAIEDIAQYTYIGEYTGVVRKKKNSTDQLNDYIFGYITCSSSTKYVVDAKDVGNITRFINHSDSPNLNSRWIEKDGICHIILYTNQYIPKGSQLTYDYGPYYWRKRAHPLTND